MKGKPPYLIAQRSLLPGKRRRAQTNTEDALVPHQMVQGQVQFTGGGQGQVHITEADPAEALITGGEIRGLAHLVAGDLAHGVVTEMISTGGVVKNTKEDADGQQAPLIEVMKVIEARTKNTKNGGILRRMIKITN